MRLMPSSTYTQSFTPNTHASFTPPNNKSIVKNVQTPSQRTGAMVGGDAPRLLQELFTILQAPRVVKPFLDSNDITQADYHSWAQQAVKFYGRNFLLRLLWNKLAVIIDPNKHEEIRPLDIVIDYSKNKATLSVVAANAQFAQIGPWLDLHIRSRVVDLEYPNEETTTVSVKLTGNRKLDVLSLSVLVAVLGRLLSFKPWVI